MIDPVTGFLYPAEWVGRCTDLTARDLAMSGLGVLTADGSVLRRGFTTGTTAAAACRAAVLSLADPVDAVSFLLPCGLEVVVRVRGDGGRGEAGKDSGDYRSDVTAGLAFVAVAERTPAGIEVEYGEGVGRFVRETPRYPLGAPAVSPTARETIEEAVRSAAASVGLPGVRVRLSIPEGAAVAAKTLNPRIGVEGGISVLGSTGLVEPWDDHLSESALERVESAEQVVLTTGRLGLRYARLLFPDREVVLVGVHLDNALAVAKDEVVICGLPGLVMKFMDPGVLAGTGCATVEELTGTPAWQGVMEQTFASFKAARPKVRVVIVARDGTVLGDSG
ncbi:cobalt-precorrin-5B (C(1))-methyltransferase [Methanofollis aquaemaris]|uniref:Cobalt-precorrin-5B C(1)-methyltransferase n=1 Tax=Methanofollis aquaemaris TaxID=126734 RepID=A0A8A3S844_9EURY|nr:cobalt-precorrin-5B (C(1))-methyltransferase [Methanofollis aquaemaris]